MDHLKAAAIGLRAYASRSVRRKTTTASVSPFCSFPVEKVAYREM
jgi:hypothetical protein